MSFVAPLSPPGIKKVYVFIDGQNMAIRYKELINQEERNPVGNISYTKDRFVWKPSSLIFPSMTHSHLEIVRAICYTVSTDSGYSELFNKIKNTKIEGNSQFYLSPEIIRYSEKDKNPKGDDIKLCIGALHYATNNFLDIAYLVTNDGDFVPLIEELQRLGKYVYVASFESSKGFNKKLKEKADFFWNLDTQYFKSNETGDK